MKFQDSSFNGLKVTVGTKSVTHARTHTHSKSNMPQLGGGPGDGGYGWGGGWLGWCGQGGCERRIEVFGKIHKKKKKMGGGGRGNI